MNPHGSRPRRSATPVTRVVRVLKVMALGLAVGLVPPREATAAHLGERLAKLTKLRDDVARARGPEAYVSLRRIWNEWDQGDPSAVEETLRSIASDGRVAASSRAYAGLLEAYARRRLGDLEGARARVSKLGYVGRWLIVGPFDNEGKQGFGEKFSPEEEFGRAIDIQRTHAGKERPVAWRITPDVSPYGWFNFGVFVRPETNVCAYAVTFARDAKANEKRSRPLSLWAGSAGAMRVYWNGTEVLKDDKYRSLDVDRFAADVTLEPGWNQIAVKVCGEEAAPMLALRVAAQDGSPANDVELDPDPSHVAELAKGTAKPLPQRNFGALEAFERRLPKGVASSQSRSAGDPALLEAYARYLVMTHSDDPAERKARELARKAAEAAPTIPRLLLAGELSENRNQRAEWIEKAEAQLSKASEEERVQVLLARAAHLRTGTNFRDAIPFYDRALAVEPDNVPATLARVELYTEAGLRETALARLERALAVRPKSVALLRAMAAALREQDRETEADETSERYAHLRFDDSAFIRSRAELAIARRQKDTATRWLERLLALEPDSANAMHLAARSYVSLGERGRAVTLYRKALELAPEDTDVMRQLADIHALGGQKDEQLALLRKILELRPQDKDVREYVAHTEPSKPRADEAYARPAAEFLKLRDAPAAGFNQRTLVDLQVTTVFPNGLASRFHQVVFQPLTEAAASDAREYSFGFEATTETVQLRGARVYRADGTIEEAAETGEGNADNPSIAMYTSGRAYYVRFPRLRPGDVVELRYRVEDVAPRNAFADYFGEVVYMQSNQPVGRAEYVLITPKSRTFYFNKPNVPGVRASQEDKGDTRIYSWVAENVPAIVPEALQPPYGELLGRVHVSTYKSWDDMGRWYWGLVRDQFVPDDEVRRRVTELTKGLKDERAKVKAVYGYVVQKTRYVALEFGIHGFKPYRCAQIFARGFGDCKDKATLIVTMLRELGIPSTIVIVRTNQKGDFETEPASLAPFDHAIAYVPSLDLYLDGTAEYTGSTELPAMDRGALALLVNEGKPKLVRLPDPPASESVVARRVEATLSADGGAQIDWRAEVTGVSAPTWRHRYHAPSTRKQRVQEDLAGEFAGFDIGAVEAGDLEDIEQPVTLRVKGKAPQLGRRDGEVLSVPVGPRDYLVREYAPLSQRKRDIRLSAQTTSVSDWVVKLPPGAKIVDAPRAAEGSSPFGTHKVEVENLPNGVRVKTTIAITRTRIAASEYAAFRKYCETVDAALGQRVTVSLR